MARLFLHLTKGEKRVEDPDGAEFDSVAEARLEALGAIREIMSDLILSGRRPGEGSIDIADDLGKVLLNVRFEDALELV